MDGRTLNSKALNAMLATFADRDHFPSEQMLKGLRSIQETLTKMLVEGASNSYYLSSLDPGVGKSTAIIKWIDAYLNHREMYGNHGIIICFDRLDEIKRFVEECNIPNDSYAVMVSKAEQELNSMGVGSNNVNNALVLFTTKQQIILRCKGKNFRDTAAFYYRGRPRTVRIWDESLIVGKELTIDRFSLFGLAEDVYKTDAATAMQIENIATDLKQYKNGDVYLMPDLGLTLNDMMYSFTWTSKAKEDTAETLGMFLGRTVTVRTDDRGYVAVDCGESIPEDFVPCLVTDASGRVRETYNLQHKYRGDLIRLQPEATKEYLKLIVYVWRMASGKGAYQTNGYQVYADEIVKVIDSRPTEEFLVVRHLEHHDLEVDILKRIQNPDRVKFIHWGIHTATNKYSHIPNIIISSPLTYRVASYEALGRASATLKTMDGSLSDNQLSMVRYGENAHHLLQAVCRGLVRKSEGSGCPESRVWLIASPRTMIEKKLDDIFPGCRVELWKTAPESLKGRKQRAMEMILKEVQKGSDAVPSTVVMKALQITRSNFKRDILNDGSFVDALAFHGMYVEKRGNRDYFVMNPFIIDSSVEYQLSA